MALQIGALSEKRLFKELLIPSWLSGLLAVTASVLLVGLAVVLTHFGNTVQQSALGLQQAYSQSSVGTRSIMVSDNFASNSVLNNVLIFILWGSIGLMVYSVVRAIVTGLKRANNVLQELNYVNADRRTIIRESFLRQSIKIVAFICFWILLRYVIFKLVPYTIAVSHTLALHPAAVTAWLLSLYVTLLCILTLHVLTVLLRLTLLRPRLFGTDITE